MPGGQSAAQRLQAAQDALTAAANQITSATTKSLYLGVGNDYVASVANPAYEQDAGLASIFGNAAGVSPTVGVAPRYYIGDEHAPGTLPGATITNIQQALKDGGYIEKGQNFTWSVWDDVTTSAYAKALGEANVRGIDVGQAINDSVTSRQGLGPGGGGSGGGGGGGGGGTAVLLPNPEDIKAIGNQTAQKLIGKDLSADQLQSFSDAFLANMQKANGYAAPSPTNAATSTLTEQMPAEAGAHAITDSYNIFAKMLSGL